MKILVEKIAYEIKKLKKYSSAKQHSSLLNQLNTMIQDNKKGHICTQPGEGGDGSANMGWDSLTNRMIETLELEGITDLESQSYNQWFAGAGVNSGAYYRLSCYFLYLKIKEKDHWNVLETLKKSQYNPNSIKRTIEFNGVKFTYDLLLSILQILKIAEYNSDILTKPIIVMDIGGGWGRIGNALCTLNPHAAYVHIDIPITSVLAQAYLPTTSEKTKAYEYAEYRNKSDVTREEILAKPGFHFLGSHQIENIENNFADITYNIASFGEMTNKTVDFYFSQIDRICCGYLYMTQINFTNPKMGFTVNGKDFYPFPDNWKKLYVRDSDIKYEYFESLHEVPKTL